MKKKFLSLLLVAALLVSSSVGAIAAVPSNNLYGNTSSADAELARVTLAVKETLDIQDSFDNFYGNPYDRGPVRLWNLSWSGEGDSIEVTADNDGKVLSYYRYINRSEQDSRYYNGSYNPFFPTVSIEAAMQTAQSFVQNLLGENEGVVYADVPTVRPVGVSTYHFSGTVTVNGLPSPVSFTVNINAEDGNVTQFSRSDAYSNTLPGYPSATAGSTAANAAELYKGTYSMKLEYVIDYDLDETGNTAVARYLPEHLGNYVVDAATGELVDISALLDGLYRDGGNVSMMSSKGSFESEAAAPQASLTPVEMDSIAQYEGVISIDDLVAIVKADKDFNIDQQYNLYSSNYSRTGEEDGEITAYLRFGYEVKDETKWNHVSKNFTLDAKTGEILSLNGYTTYDYDETDYSAKAEAFLSSRFADEFAVSKLYDNADTKYGFTYVQHENGIPFSYNSLNVTFSPVDGSVLSFFKNWSDEITFANSDNLVTADAALNTYMDSFDVVLGYTQLPVAVTPSDIQPLRAAYANAGYTYVYENILAYTLSSNANAYVYGIDAVTGELVVGQQHDAVPFVYDDISGFYAENEIATLAEYRIGFSGGSFQPTASLTELDMLNLLLSAIGYDFADEEGTDNIYSVGESYGLVTKGERNPNKLITRMDLVRSLISATEYGASAKLSGIWVPGFADDNEIADSDAGYVAIARAIGMIRGDNSGNFNPSDAVTRQDAAIILFKFMSR